MEEMSKTVKILFFLVMITFALVVATTTKNIFDSSAPEVWDNCVDGGLEQIHMHTGRIVTEQYATEEIKLHVGGNVTLVGNAIEPCGIGYQYSAGGEKYLVCEDGSVSKYVKICKNESLSEKGIGSIRALKESNMSSVTR